MPIVMDSHGAPPAWDAFSKVNHDKFDPSEYEDEDEINAKKKQEETAIVKAKPTTLSGWDPETRTQAVLTDEQLNAGGGMGCMDLDDWKVTSMDKRDVGKTLDCSHGARTVMKTLVSAGEGTATPHAPAQVEVTYVGRVRDGDALTVYDERHASTPGVFNLKASSIGHIAADTRFEVLRPAGLATAVRTMRLGERATIAVSADEGFGDDGEPALGVPPGSCLEFEVELHRIIDVCAYEQGGIVKRTLRRAPNAKRIDAASHAQRHCEVNVRWSGCLIEDAAPGEVFLDTSEPFREEADERFWVGDPNTAPWWATALPSFRLGETAELIIDAESGFGEEGSARYNVPSGCALRVTATLTSVVRVDDLSVDGDRSALRRVLSPGDGFESPRVRYDVTLDFAATLIPPPPASLLSECANEELQESYARTAAAVTRTGALVTLGTPMEEAAALRAACGGLDVDGALQRLLPKMVRGEYCELIWQEGTAGEEGTAEEGTAAVEGAAAGEAAGKAARLLVTVHSWVRVDEVPGTGGEVLLRQLQLPVFDASNPAPIPRPESVVRVRYAVRVAGGGRWRGLEAWAGQELIEQVGEPRRHGAVAVEAATEAAAGEPAIEDITDAVAAAAVAPAAAAAAAAAEAEAALGEVREFVHGERQVIPCLEFAVLRMRVGERALLTAPASFAYAAPNSLLAASIAPRLRDKDVEVLVELVGLEQARDENGMPIPEKVLLHAARKEAANRLYAQGALREAVAKWQLAEQTLPHGGSLRYDLSRSGRADEVIDAEKAVVEKVQMSCQLNLATIQLKLGEPAAALENAEKALLIDPSSVKGLLRRGQARLRIPPVDVEAAKADLLAAAKLDPRNRDIRDELERLKQIHVQHKADERKTFGGIFESSRWAATSKWDAPRVDVPKAALGAAPRAGFATTAFGSRADP